VNIRNLRRAVVARIKPKVIEMENTPEVLRPATEEEVKRIVDERYGGDWYEYLADGNDVTVLEDEEYPF